MILRPATLVVLTLAVGLTAQQWQRAHPLVGAAAAVDLARSEIVLFDGATWRFDGADWRRVPTVHAPAQLASGPMVYDSLRQRTVMVGGLPGLIADTWEFDGVDWTLRTFAGPPAARYGAALAFDALRGRVVLFGGYDGITDLADTWEYDGVAWQQVLGAAPPPRHDAALAHDLPRGRVVLFGGTWTVPLSGAIALDDTWEYDGTQWTQVATAQHPSARAFADMAFDGNRGRTVLFGGFDFPQLYHDTWEFDGATWTQVITQPSPPGGVGNLVFDPVAGVQLVGADAIWQYDGVGWTSAVDLQKPGPRRHHGLAHDRARGRTILFGGVAAGVSAPSNDTWELDDVGWSRVVTPSTPPARSRHAFAYDSARQRVLLFGGQGAGTALLQDTWTYDGVHWSQQSTPHSPSPRQGVAMADDEARERVVLFGGATATVGLGDTWEYDGNDWISVATSAAPAARVDHAMAFDAARNRVVLFGGGTATGAESDTWLYDGTNWIQAVTPNAPPGRTSHTLAYDAARGRVLLFGRGGPTGSDSWEFDGADWQSVAAAAPAGAIGGRSAYDLARRRVILYAGVATYPYPPEMLGDAWFFAPAASSSWTRYGSGCAGSNGTPRLDAAPNLLPMLGSTFALQLGSLPLPSGFAMLAFGTGVVRWNGAQLPLPLDTLGLPGCKAWLAPEVTLLLGHSGGAASFSFAIPNNPAFSGMQLATQAIVFDPVAAGGIGTVSNGGIMILK